MGAMKELAIELEVHWTRYEDADGDKYYIRQLPDGGSVTAYEDGRLGICDNGSFRVIPHDSLIGALRTAGEIAKQQLQREMMTWT